MDVPSCVLKNHFELEKQRKDILGVEMLWKLKCWFINNSTLGTLAPTKKSKKHSVIFDVQILQ